MIRAPMAVLVAAFLLPAVPLPAQNVVLDAGAFALTRNGQSLGTESFEIRQAGSGPQTLTLARGTARLAIDGGSRTVETVLRTEGPDLIVTSYQVKVSGDTQEQLEVGVTDGRLQARRISPSGEEVREYRARVGAVFLEDLLVHHYFLLYPRISAGAEVVAITPRTGTETRMVITGIEDVTLTVAGTAVPSTRVRLEAGPDAREVWFDAQGRVLRVDVPAQGLQGVRQELP